MTVYNDLLLFLMVNLNMWQVPNSNIPDLDPRWANNFKDNNVCIAKMHPESQTTPNYSLSLFPMRTVLKYNLMQGLSTIPKS
jgi:hypothetical protein